MRLFIYIILAYVFYRIAKGLFKPRPEAVHGQKTGDVIDEMVQDPVCDTYVPRRDAVKRSINGQEVYFCSKECADKFDAEKV
jgi:YHS domain-containing protein